MSESNLGPDADELTLPIKRTGGETLSDRMTDNAYHNILPARYLRQDADGNVIEDQNELFERVAKNVALAEAVFEARNRDVEVTVTPDQLKPDHPRRDELAAEVFGAGTTVGDDAETSLTEYNVNKFAYDTVVPELPEEVRDHVESVVAEFQDAMEHLSFMPNSPTLMNAGDELQQLSACIAGHAPVYTRQGLKRMDEIEVGDQVLTHEGRFKPVTAHWSNGERETIEMLRGAGKSQHYDIQLTPDHEVLDRETGWTRADTVSNPAAPSLPTDARFPETIELAQYDSRLNKEKPVMVDGGRVKLRNAEDPRTPEFDQQNNHPRANAANVDDLAWLIGLYLAEGDVYGSDVRFTLGRHEDELQEKLVERVDRVFDLSVSISESNHGEWIQCRISSSFVADFFATVCGEGVDQKRLPEWVGSADESYRQALLDAVLDGDGTELPSGYRLVLANPTLVYEITLLARSLGYDANFRRDMDREMSSKDTSGCYISTSETTKLDNVHRRDAETVEVYDMEVKDDHSFAVDDFVVHNCFVMSPDDDISDIHETARQAAEVFQCLTEDAQVYVEGEGIVSVAEVDPGDEIRQRDGDGVGTRRVEETHVYESAPVSRVQTEAGLSLTGTPNHELLVDGEWRRIDEIDPGDTLSIRLGWIADEDATGELTGTATGGQWAENRVVSNDAIRELHADGLSDYDIAARLDCSSSTVQRRRAGELELAPNGSGGRPRGSVSFDEAEFERLYEAGHTDREISSEFGISQGAVCRYRQQQSLEPNGRPVKSVTQPTSFTPDLAELVGMWVGDGSKHEDGIRFHLRRDETLERADRICRNLFDEGLDWRWDDGCYEAVLHSHEIKRWWLENFGKAKPDATTARVPDIVRRADHDTIAAFLRGLFSTDGSLQQNTYPKLWSSSEDLVDGVQQLLLGIGIPADLWEYDTDDRDYYNVGPIGKLGVERFAGLVGFVGERDDLLESAVETTEFREASVGTVRDGSVWELPVERVEDAGTDDVYDITVEDDHEYLASSVVSHNSGGGVGYGFWQLRPYGDTVGSTGGIASGPITFMRTYDQLCETIAQGGTRRGAQMGVMRVSHPDVIQFVHAKNKDVSLAHSLRLNDPDDFTHNSFAEALEEARDLIDDDGRVPEHLRNAVEGHLSNFNISVGVTDDFMEAVQAGEEFTFTNPRTGDPHVATPETKELYDMFGLGEYVEVGEELSVPAGEIWDRIVEGAHENGEPGVIYLERVNEEHSFDVEEHPDHRMLGTNPCGEQPLEEYEACNLGHINLSTLAAEDAPDWRVWSDRHAADYDSHEEAVEAFLAEAIDWEEFDRRIELGTRFLENVVTMSDFPVSEIEETVREMRKIGLGIMGLAQLYIQLGIEYGSEAGNEVARQVMTHINHESKWTSHELAEERGSFAQWDDSKYADPTEYREWFEHHTGLDADEWKNGFEIRNHNSTTIAPTGTTSMLGNTTGGCEPIYNVAYYKNVSEDVQGDEMLVEFDDYFLRTLEANDIDVEAVKQEAQEQMAENEFDGVSSLETVPDAIGELFVTTGDLTAKEHAAVQCACQEGVDSAISKTTNAPNDASLEDAREVFEYIYENGGKGVTYYRDGTRSKQVLTTRAQNREFADAIEELPREEAAEVLVDQIQEVFGGLESFLEDEEVRAGLEADVEDLFGDGRERSVAPRPDTLRGVSQRIETGYGKLYVTINENPETGDPFEVFANIGHSGGFTNSFTEAIGKVTSSALRAGVPPEEVVDELCGTRSPKVAWDKGEQIQSIPDAIGTALRRYLDGEIDKQYPQQKSLSEVTDGDGGMAPTPDTEPDGGTATRDGSQDVIDAGENPECPSCGAMSLYYSEGCKTCEACGWSEC